MPTMTEATTALPFDEAVAQAAGSHKDQAAGKEVIIPDDLRDIAGERANNLGERGGLFRRIIGGVATYVTVRAPVWRGSENDPAVRTTDLMVVHGLNRASKELPGQTRMATEVEGFVIDAQSNPIDASDPNDAHPELFADCIEEATKPAGDMVTAAEHMYDAYARLWTRAQHKGGIFYPGSNLAHRPRTPADINPHPYVWRIVNTLGARTQPDLEPAETLVWLDGASVQTHVERALNHAAGAYALNMHSALLSPATMGLTAASPFSRGDYLPEFHHPYEAMKSKVGYVATRYLGRRIGTPEAGPLRQFISEDPLQAAIDINGRMKDGAINNPGRVGNQHGDVRSRTDLAPHGTHELCAKDSGGGHIESLMAIASFERTYMHILEQAYKNNRTAELARRYPTAVAANLQENEQQLLKQAHINNELIAQRGLDAEIVTPDGHVFTARQALFDTMKMVADEMQRPENAPYRLSKDVFDWMDKRAGRPDYADIQAHAGRENLFDRFYRGEPGTLADYKRIRVSQLMMYGDYPASNAIAQAQVEIATAHKKYLERLASQSVRHKAFGFLRQDYGLAS